MLLSDASSGPSVSGLGSALPRPRAQQIPLGTITPVLPTSPPPSPENPLSWPFDRKATRGPAYKKWNQLKRIREATKRFSESPSQARLLRSRRVMVSSRVKKIVTSVYILRPYKVTLASLHYIYISLVAF